MSTGSEYVDTWCERLPDLHRTLTTNGQVNYLPAFLGRSEQVESCTYWETLVYLLRGLLGWRSLGLGLSWWYKNGKNDMGDPRLRLLRTVWDSEGQLDFFAAWAWTSPCSNLKADGGYEQNSPNRLTWASEEWWHTFERRGHPYPYSPYGGGTNPLHLGHSDDYGFSAASCKPIGYRNKDARQAVLVVNSISSWRSELAAFSNSLPDLGNRSWHVEIFDRSCGYLGLYRQSRVTGLWFMGKHSIHMRGNSQADGD